ncbi:prepilin-type N-terminal cleavage/methylation domain-containing protein [Neobacillus niacini]|uniref:PulJ/GspJ family protein n=1 Tax=Neobacillus niacini TaxID=86668 RepID=UPI0028560212|nr:prepilin-type N-terminal cleavage/methylation domain-containing protein [Neobacillus niacini]MDR7001470.1 prepilin-type N-terminal cleavage/methylation domain-containing protein [Neobacillus niacini]
MIRDERGLTLIELLATITILSIIGIVIWNVFIQGNKVSQKSMSKNSMVQEANLVITNLTRIFQTSKQFQLTSLNCQLSVTFTNQDNTVHTQVFENDQMCFSATNISSINPGETDVNFSITVSGRKDINNQVTISSLLYRLKDGDV